MSAFTPETRAAYRTAIDQARRARVAEADRRNRTAEPMCGCPYCTGAKTAPNGHGEHLYNHGCRCGVCKLARRRNCRRRRELRAEMAQ